MSVFTRKKHFDAELAAAPGTLSLLDLSAYGIAAVVGSGIFATVGRVALFDAGLFAPVSVLIAGGLSLATAICYLEFASALPVSGSSYAYMYGMVGEAWGWAAGWNLTLEYAFAAAAIAGAWSDGLKAVCDIYKTTLVAVPEQVFVASFGHTKVFPVAAVMVVLIGFLASLGVKLGARLTNAVSLLNISLILMIIAVGAVFVQAGNWKEEPYLAPSKGWAGVVEGGSHMFFAYIGYDTVSTLSTDAISPSRDVPKAVFVTLATATVLYIGVALVLTGMQRWDALAPESSLVRAFESTPGARWAAPVVSIGSLTTMAATVMACLIGQPKIFKAMADDGLLPDWIAGTDSAALRFTVLLTAGLALFVDFNDPSNGINDAISFGVLLGMSAVCVALLVVRFQRAASKSNKSTSSAKGINCTIIYSVGCLMFSFLMNCGATEHLQSNIVWPILLAILVVAPFIPMLTFYKQVNPDSLSPAFSCPLMPILPAIAILANSFVLMTTWRAALLPFAVWTGMGGCIYVFYGRHNSRLTGKYNN